MRIVTALRAVSRDEESMSEHTGHQPFDVVRQRVGAALDKRQGLNAAEERDRAARAYAEFDFRMLPGGVHDVKHVVDDFFVDVDFAAFVLKRDDISRREHRFHRGFCDCRW